MESEFLKNMQEDQVVTKVPLSDKLSKILASKKAMFAISLVGLYLISLGTSWAFFSYVKEAPVLKIEGEDQLQEVRKKIGEGQPKTEDCPINGAKFTKAEKEIWQTRRPIAAVVENHLDARPQSGLSKADVVYEAVAEGGITRFLAIFYCGAASEEVKIAPVRSARVPFIDWASGYGDSPIFMHVGGANDYSGSGDTARQARALELLESIGWRVPKGNDFDTTYDSGYPIFWRNYERLSRPVATEHTMMASLDAAYLEAIKRGFVAESPEGIKWDKSFTPWKFKDGASSLSSSTTKISFSFWEGMPDYNVTWEYDSQNNQYLRVNGGQKHEDFETKTQLLAKNVAIVFVKERASVDRNKHVLYTTIGSGKALVFQNGEVVEGTWEKDSREDAIIFRNQGKKEVSFAPGPIWVEVLPVGNKVEY